MGLGPGPGGAYSASKVANLVPLYQKLRATYPRCSAAKRLPLDFLSGAAFDAGLEDYVKPLLRKVGVEGAGGGRKGWKGLTKGGGMWGWRAAGGAFGLLGPTPPLCPPNEGNPQAP